MQHSLYSGAVYSHGESTVTLCNMKKTIQLFHQYKQLNYTQEKGLIKIAQLFGFHSFSQF